MQVGVMLLLDCAEEGIQVKVQDLPWLLFPAVHFLLS
jgi:hypothetical protein